MMSKCHEQFSQEDSSEIATVSHPLEQKSLSFWHKKFLEKYIQNDINPYGLRIQKFPNLPEVSDSFCQKWELNVQACTKQMMLLLCEVYDSQTVKIDKDIEAPYNLNSHITSSILFQEKEKILQEQIELHNKNIITNKEKKFVRDQRAFRERRAYRWEAGKVISKPRNQSNSQQSKGYGYQSDSSSLLSSASQYSGPSKKAGNKKEKNTERRHSFQF